VKIYAAAVESVRKKERGDENRMKLSLAQKHGQGDQGVLKLEINYVVIIS
jgi:hypothetical protein